MFVTEAAAKSDFDRVVGVVIFMLLQTYYEKLVE